MGPVCDRFPTAASNNQSYVSTAIPTVCLAADTLHVTLWMLALRQPVFSVAIYRGGGPRNKALGVKASSWQFEGGACSNAIQKRRAA